MQTHQQYIDQFNQFCDTVISKHKHKANSPRSLQNFMNSLKTLPERIKLMEKEMVDQANKVLHDAAGNADINHENLKTELIEMAKSCIISQGGTVL